MTENSRNSNPPSEAVLLAEYAAANQVYLQYDGFRWQAGSFLIAGVFVYWGFLIQSNARAALIGMSSLLVALLMSCWILFASHYRQLYLQKLHRMHEIELQLGMEQHLRFAGQAPSGVRYQSLGIKGRDIDLIVYLITTLGGSMLAWTQSGFSGWDLAAFPVAAVVVWHVTNNERTLAERRKLGFHPFEAPPKVEGSSNQNSPAVQSSEASPK